MGKELSKAGQSGKTGNYFMGTIGAVLGSILGTLFWIAFSFINVAPPIGAFVAGFFACLGYSWLGGKKTNAMMLIVSLTLIVLSFVSVFAGHAAVDSAAGQGAFFSLFASGLATPFTGAPAPLWVEIILGWILGITAMYIFSRIILRHESERVAAAAAAK